jgi:nicotinate-nucleotide adenylyltransferase
MRQSAPGRFGGIDVRLPHVEPGQAIGLLGGSFNPPHAAHRLISQAALKRLALDKVWWVVTPGNPLKRRSDLAPLERRLQLCRTVANTARIEITAFEAEIGTSFTAAALAFLKGRCPGVRFIWLMGADNLASFHRWQHWREIFQLMPIAVFDRPGWGLKALASRAAQAFSDKRLPESKAKLLAQATPPAWVFLTGPRSTLSSTELRKAGSLAVAETPQPRADRARQMPKKTRARSP